MNLLTSLRKELLEAWRGKRFLVAIILLGAFGMMSPLLARFMRELFTAIPGAEMFSAMIPAPTIMDAIGQYVKNIEQFGILLALLLSMGLVAVEKERGTAALVLSKPLPRSTFILAKFLGIAIVLLTALIVAAIGGYYYTLVPVRTAFAGGMVGFERGDVAVDAGGGRDHIAVFDVVHLPGGGCRGRFGCVPVHLVIR